MRRMSLVVSIFFLISLQSVNAMEKTIKSPVPTRSFLSMILAPFISKRETCVDTESGNVQAVDSVVCEVRLNKKVLIPGKVEMPCSSPRKTPQEIVSNRPPTPFPMRPEMLSMATSPEASSDSLIFKSSFEYGFPLVSCLGCCSGELEECYCE